MRFAGTLNEHLVLMIMVMMNHQHHDHLQPKTLDPEPHVGPKKRVGALFHVPWECLIKESELAGIWGLAQLSGSQGVFLVSPHHHQAFLCCNFCCW